MDLSKPPPDNTYKLYFIISLKIKSYKRHIAPERWENNLIHINLQGLFEISHNNYTFIITFLNNFTLRSDIYLLSNKFSQFVLIVFKLFLNNIKYNDYRYTRLRSDYDTKFQNYKIEAFRLFRGIIWKGIVSDNPQMNNKSERISAIIQRKASAMLKESELP